VNKQALIVFAVDHPWVLLVLPVLWCLRCDLGGLTSGWNALSLRFTACSEPQGQPLHAGAFFDSVYWRLSTRYGASVKMTAASDALYLSVPSISRLGHPPLCIPWNEVTVGRTDRPRSFMVALSLGKEEHILLRISERRAAKLGFFERFPSELGVPLEPNFDRLSDAFVESQMKRPD